MMKATGLTHKALADENITKHPVTEPANMENIISLEFTFLFIKASIEQAISGPRKTPSMVWAIVNISPSASMHPAANVDNNPIMRLANLATRI